MKSLITLIIFLISLCSTKSFAITEQFLEQTCPKDQSAEQLNDYQVCEFTPYARSLKEQRDQMAALLPKEVAELSTLFSSFDQLHQLFANKRDEIRELQRWAKGENYGPAKNAELQERWDVIEEAVVEIEETQRAIVRLENMLQVCRRGNCGAQRRVELEDEWQKLKKLQQYLIAQNPWLVGDSLIEHLGKVEENDTITTELRKQLYIASTAQMATHMSKIEGGLHSMKLMEENSFLARAPQFSYSQLQTTYFARHPEAYEFAIKHALLNGYNKEVLCPMARDFHFKNKLIERGKTTAQVGLLVASIALIPESALLSWSRLGQFMSKVPTRVRSLSSLGAEAGFAGLWYDDWKQLKQTCERQQAQNVLEIEHQSLESYQQCLENAQDHLELGLLVGASSASLQLMPKLAQRMSRAPAQSFSSAPSIREVTVREKIIPEGGFAHTVVLPKDQHLTFMDLGARTGRQKSQINQLPDEYWDYVGEVYSQQLNLSAQEVRSFVETSKELAPRTKLITMTRGPPRAQGNQFDGGIGYVESSSAQQILPLEKATGISLPRGQGKVIEVVRLTSTSKESPELMRDLLHSLGALVKQDPEIEKVYVFTSKIHQRLYRRLGIEADSVRKISDRDVIIEISRDKFLAPL